MPNPVQAAAEGLPKSLTDHFEEPIDNARRMASILAGLLEDAMGEDMAKYGRPGSYHITKSQVEDIMFSVYQTQGFINRIHTAFVEAVQ